MGETLFSSTYQPNPCSALDVLAFVLVPSELPEELGLSDLVLVLREGKIAGEFARTEASPEKVMAAATGTTEEAVMV